MRRSNTKDKQYQYQSLLETDFVDFNSPATSPFQQRKHSCTTDCTEEVHIQEIFNSKPRYEDECNLPEPVPLQDLRRSKSAHYDSGSVSFSADTRNAVSGTSDPKFFQYSIAKPRDLGLYSEAFPTILRGIVPEEEFKNAIRSMNSVLSEVLKKWYNNEKFSVCMFAAGGIALLPIIPAVMLEVRKAKNIKRGINHVIDQINSNCYSKGYRWRSFINKHDSEIIPHIVLEIDTDLHQLFHCAKNDFGRTASSRGTFVGEAAF